MCIIYIYVCVCVCVSCKIRSKKYLAAFVACQRPIWWYNMKQEDYHEKGWSNGLFSGLYRVLRPEQKRA